jgi:hypothetical protein
MGKSGGNTGPKGTKPGDGEQNGLQTCEKQATKLSSRCMLRADKGNDDDRVSWIVRVLIMHIRNVADVYLSTGNRPRDLAATSH